MKFLDRVGDALGFILAIGFVTAMVMLPACAEPVYVLNCSGTYIGEGYVLTAGHCTDQDGLFVSQSNPEKAEPGSEPEKYTAKLVWSTLNRDFGLIRLDKALVKRSKEERENATDDDKFKKEAIKAIPFKASKVACVVPKIGESMTMKGWPAGEYAEVSGVVASGARKIGHWDVAQFVAMPGFYGNSGSGVTNDKGEVVALLVGMIRGSSLMIQVPTAEICNVLPREIK